jgi:hypothetical protein
MNENKPLAPSFMQRFLDSDEHKTAMVLVCVCMGFNWLEHHDPVHLAVTGFVAAIIGLIMVAIHTALSKPGHYLLLVIISGQQRNVLINTTPMAFMTSRANVPVTLLKVWPVSESEYVIMRMAIEHAAQQARLNREEEDQPNV